MPTIREDQNALTRVLELLLGFESNGVAIVASINGKTIMVAGDLPNLPLDSDDNIGAIGYSFGVVTDCIEKKVTEKFNEIVGGK